MGWIGSNSELLNALRVVNADRDEDGKFKVYGAPPVSFMGADEEYVVPDECEYSVGGQRRPLAALLNSTSAGMGVTVI